MNIQNLPSEILEKILVEGNFLSISRVCQTWRYHAQKNKFKFNEIFFDTTNDNPEKIKKENPNQLTILNSLLSDKNKINNILFDKNIIKKCKKIFKKITSLNTLNFIFEISMYVDARTKNGNKYCLFSLFEFVFWANYLPQKKTLNIEIKYVCENIYQETFLDFEIDKTYNILINSSYTCYEKFTFNMPNNNYIIYDKNKKLLIIRFGNYEKYNFPMAIKTICNKYNKDEFGFCSNSKHKQYHVNSFSIRFNWWLGDFYPARLIMIDYKKLTENVKKLIVISSEYHDFMFDQLLKTSKSRKKIEYHCFDSSKMKFEQKYFKFVPVEKEKVQEYSFKQIHFKYFGENIY